MKNNLEETLKIVRNYYIESNKPIPKSVVSYIADFPPGYSRQAIQNNLGIKTSEFVSRLNPEYEKPLDAATRVAKEADRLGYTILTDVSTLTNNRDKVELLCKICGNKHVTTIISLAGSKLGCPLCKSGNLAWNRRGPELELICADRLECEIVSDIPNNQTGYIRLKHICGTEFETQLVGVVSPNSKLRATCPNCRPTDRRVTINGITFGSQFEADCYLILKHLNPELHVKYSEYFATDRRWICDFKLGSYWIEVSNFKQDYKNYFLNIEEKQLLVESNGADFFFVQTLKELEELVNLM